MEKGKKKGQAERLALGLTGLSYAEVAALSRFISRDLRREALFLWTMLLVAARSSALTAEATVIFAWSASPLSIAATAFFTDVRVLERTVRLMMRLRS